MPTYAYRCDECNHQFEKLQKMSDEPLKHCPSCFAEKLVKIINAGGGFQLKGKGWFKSGGY
jgi:putative FmdB family regulatory protein|tara:strand:- start:4427 stop:4609 length:183 start_codon:yes stop_codon:yes gene_type:complete